MGNDALFDLVSSKVLLALKKSDVILEPILIIHIKNLQT